MGLLLALVLVALVALRATAVSPFAPVLRHLYLLPVVVAGLRFGLVGGAVAAVGTVVLDAPLVLPGVERAGLSVEGAESLVTFALVLAGGTLAGVLADAARAGQRRYELLLSAQQAVAGEAPLDEVLGRLHACLAERVPARGLALAARDGERLVVAGATRLATTSCAAAVLEQAAPVFVADVGRAARPWRAFVAPLVVGGQCRGVLAIEREGELRTGERQALATLGVHLGLLLENARLASRQRRFTEELADKVAAATRRLEEMDRTKSAFVAVASHELRTPLTALLGFGELLATRRFPPEETRRLAEIVRSETERLVRIVDDFLDLSRLERGLPPGLRRAAVDVGPAVAAVVELLRGIGTHRLVIDCPPAVSPVHADPMALDRILRNLVGNALKYAPPGSTVRVVVRDTAAGVEFAVEDTGRGIPPEVLPRIFEPYYRAPDADRAARGTGLGLAVVKALVDAHEGEIRVSSVPGCGTRVVFRLPRLPAPAA